MRFFTVMLMSAALHAYVLWAVEESRPPSLPLARGEFCVDMRASFASFPSPERDAPQDPTDKVKVTPVAQALPPVPGARRIPDKVPTPQETPLTASGEVKVTPATPAVPPKRMMSAKVPAPEEAPLTAPDEVKLTPVARAVPAAPEMTGAALKSNNPTPLPASKSQPASRPSTPRHQGVTRGASLPNHYKPVYPREAHVRGIEGQVIVAARISTRGEALEVRVEQSSGYAVLDEAAEQFARSVRFQPARRGSTPVEADVTLPVVYRLRD